MINKFLHKEIDLSENELEMFEFEIKTIGTKGNSYFITIDDHEYGFKPINGTTEQIAKKFKMILKHSPGKALAWLKKHAKLISGSKEKKKVNEMEKEMNEKLPSERVPTFSEFVENNKEKTIKEEPKEDLKKEKDTDPDIGSKYTKKGEE